jgi:ATP phosphoribosyltransferase regulatory subunit
MTTSANTLPRERFLAPLIARGFTVADPAILQPARLMLDALGDDLGRRLFTTSDAAGAEYCLRPDMTAPICIEHVATGAEGREARYCYWGKVFRWPEADEPAELIQAGVELLGHADRVTADVEVFEHAIATARAAGGAPTGARVNDLGLFEAIVAALPLSPAWRARLRKAYGNGTLEAATIDRLAVPPGFRFEPDTARALAGLGRQPARALVADLLAMAGQSTIAGRAAVDIAERVVDQMAESLDEGVPATAKATIAEVLAIACPLGQAPKRLATALGALTAEPGVAGALDTLARRADAIARSDARGTEPAFDIRLAARLDYYTGFYFEVPADGSAQPGVRGGRYDRLMTRFGAAEPIPAVGFSAYVGNLAGASR